MQISTNLIHDVTSLRYEGYIALNKKNMKKVVLGNAHSTYNGRGIVISKIKQDDVIFFRKTMTSKMCSSSREDDVAIGFVHVVYMIHVDKSKVKLCEILRA